MLISLNLVYVYTYHVIVYCFYCRLSNRVAQLIPVRVKLEFIIIIIIYYNNIKIRLIKLTSKTGRLDVCHLCRNSQLKMVINSLPSQMSPSFQSCMCLPATPIRWVIKPCIQLSQTNNQLLISCQRLSHCKLWSDVLAK